MNPIQSSGGGNTGSTNENADDDITNQNQIKNSKVVTPEDVLNLSKIADEYLCRPGGWKECVIIFYHFLFVLIDLIIMNVRQEN